MDKQNMPYIPGNMITSCHHLWMSVVSAADTSLTRPRQESQNDEPSSLGQLSGSHATRLLPIPKCSKGGAGADLDLGGRPALHVLPELLAVPEALDDAVQEAVVLPGVVLEPWRGDVADLGARSCWSRGSHVRRWEAGLSQRRLRAAAPFVWVLHYRAARRRSRQGTPWQWGAKEYKKGAVCFGITSWG